ncbi:pyruvate ferredoxin oxidoreductase [Candidatus Kuenenbacteria bacterium HGW-Kuenenbacteria-1]|uniref:Pyruvate ferredoxin oxidoreductase n=1 Tax=Candidatus Kuenenbacteria bacterium HGW-Kuenenbacteria-1 TaxID=2013812 RepID=A0A2N1UP59_9BACT|nr:MAG: pyruvate ferredoxin oxidoreductase [Candidatus Kuenenbacteria bacterium HGW-Kuenenbacteria-1]
MKNEKIKLNIKALTGAEAVAEAMRQINPSVVSIYPITPQTPIIEKFSKFVANGLVDSEIITVESEHSAMSAVVGAQASGVRAMTATSSQGLALMWEILGIASGLRLPIVMPVVNRALSAPLNIHCDHSDSMGCRDFGWIQIYSENNQEAYENILLAMKVAEQVKLPAMVMQDGFITSHCVEAVKILPDKIVQKFLEKYQPAYSLLDIKNPITVGSFISQPCFFEIKCQQIKAMEQVKKVYLQTGKEFSRITKRKYEYFEKYKLDDAEYGIVVMSSTAGTVKAVVDKMRSIGFKVGLLKPILFRPFPYQEIAQALAHLKAVAILDRSVSVGAFPPLYSEIVNCQLLNVKCQSYIFGLGGQDIFEKDIEKVFMDLLNKKINKKEIKYIK